MAKKVRRSGNRRPGGGKAAVTAGSGVMAGEIEHVAGKTGLSVAKVRECLFHSDSYRASEQAASGAEAKLEAAVDEIMSGKRSIEDVFDEMAARSEENLALADAAQAVAGGRPAHVPERRTGDEPEFPPEWETDYVVRKTGLPRLKVLDVFMFSGLCRVDQGLAELEAKFGRGRGGGPKGAGKGK